MGLNFTQDAMCVGILNQPKERSIEYRFRELNDLKTKWVVNQLWSFEISED